ncbi:hypothetical protein HanRHA438_Chr06g0263371 [Helianthus annuus]|nr:hypothetical protein HanHA300_Chr06g0208661 [Helianthus annuus]KAJ0573185.1 hypothetical protein HanHA89_Chr06g0224011 [Helianthus annuus]KAJ0911453.1 hypothetical protein HanRHA438_Chr06g0263371 [Helianthus annuus]
MVGCLAGETPFKYLALMVGANMNLINNWKPMFDVFETRLSSWKANTLSMGGRIVLVKSVLESLPNYYFSLYRAPSKVIKDLEKLIRRFLWGGNSENCKMHWVLRDRVTIPKEDGGIGICKLKRINTTLLTKWVWRFKSENDQLWRKVVEAIHTSRRNWDFLPTKKCCGGVWINIVKTCARTKIEGTTLRRFSKGEVGDGQDIAFWIDPWLDNEPLKDIYTRTRSGENASKCENGENDSQPQDLNGLWLRLMR